LKRPHLLRVAREAGAFTPLAEAVAAAGLRLGWLELGGAPEAPTALVSAASLPAFRAVAAGAGRSVSVKPLHGPPVLDDLLREHFLGCALVLVAGEAAETVPALEPREGGGWRVISGGEVRELTTGALVSALMRPRPIS